MEADSIAVSPSSVSGGLLTSVLAEIEVGGQASLAALAEVMLSWLQGEGTPEGSSPLDSVPHSVQPPVHGAGRSPHGATAGQPPSLAQAAADGDVHGVMTLLHKLSAGTPPGSDQAPRMPLVPATSLVALARALAHMGCTAAAARLCSEAVAVARSPGRLAHTGALRQAMGMYAVLSGSASAPFDAPSAPLLGSAYLLPAAQEGATGEGGQPDITAAAARVLHAQRQGVSTQRVAMRAVGLALLPPPACGPFGPPALPLAARQTRLLTAWPVHLLPKSLALPGATPAVQALQAYGCVEQGVPPPQQRATQGPAHPHHAHCLHAGRFPSSASSLPQQVAWATKQALPSFPTLARDVHVRTAQARAQDAVLLRAAAAAMDGGYAALTTVLQAAELRWRQSHSTAAAAAAAVMAAVLAAAGDGSAVAAVHWLQLAQPSDAPQRSEAGTLQAVAQAWQALGRQAEAEQAWRHALHAAVAGDGGLRSVQRCVEGLRACAVQGSRPAQ